MKRLSTMILRLTIVLIGLFIFGVCLFALPVGLRNDATGYYKPIVIGLYVAAIPFFYALVQAMKLLRVIDQNLAFTKHSVKAFRHIKYSALLISGLFALGLPYVYFVADKDDAPGVIAGACIIVFASLVIATFSAVLQKLVQNAVDIKAENDLTV